MSTLWITQLSLLLEDALCHPYIHWNDAGNGVLIVDQAGFVKHVLPRYYEANCGWPSFQRNLCHYKFSRVHGVSEAYDHHYTHDMFHRDNKDNLHLIKPKPRHAPPKPTLKEGKEGGASGAPSTASAATHPKLAPSGSGSGSGSGGGGGGGGKTTSTSLGLELQSKRIKVVAPPAEGSYGTKGASAIIPSTSSGNTSQLLDVFSSFDSHKPQQQQPQPQPQQPQPGLPEQLILGQSSAALDNVQGGASKGEKTAKRRRRFMSMEGGAPEASDEGADPSNSSSIAAQDALLVDGGGSKKGGKAVNLIPLHRGVAPQRVVVGRVPGVSKGMGEEESSPKFKLRGEGSGSKSGSGASEGPLHAMFPTSSQIQSAGKALSLDDSSGLTISLPPFNASLRQQEAEGGGSSTTFSARHKKLPRGGLIGKEEEGKKDDQDGMNLSTGGGEGSKGGKEDGGEEEV